jgi:HSP20 family molecular chaperone IbpA
MGRNPFTALQRFADEVDRMFDDFGLSRRWGRAPLWRGAGAEMWAPDIDVYQKDDQLIIKADVPGLTKDDVSVDITDDAVTIQGERKAEREEEREGLYRSERSYGCFCRVVPLVVTAETPMAVCTRNFRREDVRSTWNSKGQPTREGALLTTPSVLDAQPSNSARRLHSNTSNVASF